MTRILITGAAGFIASNLCRYILARTNWTIVALDRLDPAGALSRLTDCFRDYPGRIAMVHHDLRAEISDYVAVEILTGGGAFTAEPFDYIAHLAAGSHVERAQKDPLGFILDNVVGTATLLNFVKAHSALTRKFLLFSTDETMGPAPPGVAFKAADRQFPRNLYAASKAGSESVAMAYAETFDIPLIITRCTNAIGPRGPGNAPGQSDEKFPVLMCRKLLAGETVKIHTVDGVPCSRYYVHVSNICSAVLHVLMMGKCMDGTDGTGIYHIAGEREITNVEFVEFAANVLGATARYEMQERPPGRLKPDLRYCLDDSELRALGWKPEIGFEAGLVDTILSYR
jgi:dTDP-glucose 4,6-dehydratase